MVHVNGLGDSLQLDVEPIDVSYFCKLTPKVSIALLSLAKKKTNNEILELDSDCRR